MTVENIRRCQAEVRKVAQKFTVEEALNGLAAVAAEAVLTVPPRDRRKLTQIFTGLVLDYTDKAAAGLGAPGLPIKLQ